MFLIFVSAAHDGHPVFSEFFSVYLNHQDICKNKKEQSQKSKKTTLYNGKISIPLIKLVIFSYHVHLNSVRSLAKALNHFMSLSLQRLGLFYTHISARLWRLLGSGFQQGFGILSYCKSTHSFVNWSSTFI